MRERQRETGEKAKQNANIGKIIWIIATNQSANIITYSLSRTTLNKYKGLTVWKQFRANVKLRMRKRVKKYRNDLMK